MLSENSHVILDEKTKRRLCFSRFPAYAGYLLKNRLHQLAVDQLNLFEDLNPPVFRYFSHLPANDKLEMAKKELGKWLHSIENNEGPFYIENSLKGWLNNQLPQISRNQIEAEDITGVNLIRRKILRKYIGDFTTESSDMIQILNEIDEFTTSSETAAFRLLLELQQSEHIKIQDLLAEKSVEVRHHEERYFRMINEIEDYAILRLSREGLIENWNTGAEKIKGYKAGEIIGKHIRIFYSPEDQQAKLPETLINHAIEHGKAIHEGWRLRKDRTKFWGSILITALHDENNQIVGFSKVTRDLTSKKIADDNLLKYTERIESNNRELEEKNKQLASFNYIASHDLQEPVRKIKVFISKIRMDESLSPVMSDQMEKISRACDRMKDLIEGLLLYCHGDIQDRNDHCRLDELIEEVAADYIEGLDEFRIHTGNTEMKKIAINRGQMKQVFQNIIANAIKYRKENSPLTLTVNISAETRSISPEGVSDYYKMVFEDNGIGFDQGYADRIFGLFQRLHDHRKYEGTGIGLAICKKIIENHQGEIFAEATKDKGAKFIILLPV